MADTPSRRAAERRSRILGRSADRLRLITSGEALSSELDLPSPSPATVGADLPPASATEQATPVADLPPASLSSLPASSDNLNHPLPSPVVPDSSTASTSLSSSSSSSKPQTPQTLLGASQASPAISPATSDSTQPTQPTLPTSPITSARSVLSKRPRTAARNPSASSSLPPSESPEPSAETLETSLHLLKLRSAGSQTFLIAYGLSLALYIPYLFFPQSVDPLALCLLVVFVHLLAFRATAIAFCEMLSAQLASSGGEGLLAIVLGLMSSFKGLQECGSRVKTSMWFVATWMIGLSLLSNVNRFSDEGLVLVN